jgi:thiol:disulfide interchange protein
LQAQGVPVFVSFGADWCLTCEMNERFVLKSEKVQTFFSERNIVWLKADLTYDTPYEVMVWMNKLHKSGLPVYFYSDREGVIHPLSEWITPRAILALE